MALQLLLLACCAMSAAANNLQSKKGYISAAVLVRNIRSDGCIMSTMIQLNTHYLALPCSPSQIYMPDNTHPKAGTHYTWTLPKTLGTEELTYADQGNVIIKQVNQNASGPAACQLANGEHKTIYKHHILVYDKPRYRFDAKFAFDIDTCSITDRDVQAKIKLIHDVACPAARNCDRRIQGSCVNQNLLQIGINGREFLLVNGKSCRGSVDCSTNLLIGKATSDMEFLLKELKRAHLKESGSNRLKYNADQTSASVGIVCSTGYYYHREQKLCLPCAPGSFLDVRSTQCLPCPTGTYQNQYGAAVCKRCPASYSMAYTGAKSLEECNATDAKTSSDEPPSCEYKHGHHMKTFRTVSEKHEDKTTLIAHEDTTIPTAYQKDQTPSTKKDATILPEVEKDDISSISHKRSKARKHEYSSRVQEKKPDDISNTDTTIPKTEPVTTPKSVAEDSTEKDATILPEVEKDDKLDVSSKSHKPSKARKHENSSRVQESKPDDISNPYTTIQKTEPVTTSKSAARERTVSYKEKGAVATPKLATEDRKKFRTVSYKEKGAVATPTLATEDRKKFRTVSYKEKDAVTTPKLATEDRKKFRTVSYKEKDAELATLKQRTVSYEVKDAELANLKQRTSGVWHEIEQLFNTVKDTNRYRTTKLEQISDKYSTMISQMRQISQLIRRLQSTKYKVVRQNLITKIEAALLQLGEEIKETKELMVQEVGTSVNIEVQIPEDKQIGSISKRSEKDEVDNTPAVLIDVDTSMHRQRMVKFATVMAKLDEVNEMWKQTQARAEKAQYLQYDHKKQLFKDIEEIKESIEEPTIQLTGIEDTTTNTSYTSVLQMERILDAIAKKLNKIDAWIKQYNVPVIVQHAEENTPNKELSGQANEKIVENTPKKELSGQATEKIVENTPNKELSGQANEKIVENTPKKELSGQATEKIAENTPNKELSGQATGKIAENTPNKELSGQATGKIVENTPNKELSGQATGKITVNVAVQREGKESKVKHDVNVQDNGDYRNGVMYDKSISDNRSNKGHHNRKPVASNHGLKPQKKVENIDMYSGEPQKLSSERRQKVENIEQYRGKPQKLSSERHQKVEDIKQYRGKPQKLAKKEKQSAAYLESHSGDNKSKDKLSAENDAIKSALANQKLVEEIQNNKRKTIRIVVIVAVLLTVLAAVGVFVVCCCRQSQKMDSGVEDIKPVRKQYPITPTPFRAQNIPAYHMHSGNQNTARNPQPVSVRSPQPAITHNAVGSPQPAVTHNAVGSPQPAMYTSSVGPGQVPQAQPPTQYSQRITAYGQKM